jgi:hypothetical protein
VEAAIWKILGVVIGTDRSTYSGVSFCTDYEDRSPGVPRIPISSSSQRVQATICQIRSLVEKNKETDRHAPQIATIVSDAR